MKEKIRVDRQAAMWNSALQQRGSAVRTMKQRLRMHGIAVFRTFKHRAESHPSPLAPAAPVLADISIRSHSNAVALDGTVQIVVVHAGAVLALCSSHSRSDAWRSTNRPLPLIVFAFGEAWCSVSMLIGRSSMHRRSVS
jgi:hypothetical protein